MISPEEHEERLALYRQGLSDREIGKRLYLNNTTIFMWRKINHLPANHPRVPYLPMEEEQRRMEAYRKGLTNKEMAAELGLTRECVRDWVARRGLKGNKGENHDR